MIIFSDLDRTIIPNGEQPESKTARPLLRQLAENNFLKLVYVTGRSANLTKQAIAKYDLPTPDYAICDVGTTIYKITNNHWQILPEWHKEIAKSWRGKTANSLKKLFTNIGCLDLQEPEKQNDFKLSYYIPVDADQSLLCCQVGELLGRENIRAAVICSIDEKEGIAFLDILPENATKLHSIKFLLKRLNLTIIEAVFSGDSGNDMPVLTSEIQAVLVANATPEVRAKALAESEKNGTSAHLYLAKGMGKLNGNYSSGLLEGAAYFLPDIKKWLNENMG